MTVCAAQGDLQVRTLAESMPGRCIQVHSEVGLLAARLADGCWMQQRDKLVKQKMWFVQHAQVSIRYWEQLSVNNTGCDKLYEI